MSAVAVVAWARERNADRSAIGVASAFQAEQPGGVLLEVCVECNVGLAQDAHLDEDLGQPGPDLGEIRARGQAEEIEIERLPVPRWCVSALPPAR